MSFTLFYRFAKTHFYEKTGALSAEILASKNHHFSRFSKKHDFSNFREKPIFVHDLKSYVIRVVEIFVILQNRSK